MENYL